jgi:hypothetical protein
MKAAFVSIALVSAPVFAQVGFYKLLDPPGAARKSGEMCIRAGSDGVLQVSLFGSYCPTVGNDCADAHFDDIEFGAKPRRSMLMYTNKNCVLTVALGKNGATVTQKGHCTDYDILAGKYAKRASEVWEDDCSPRGNSSTHHE